MGTKLDLTGRRFGLLTAIKIDGKTSAGVYKWLCRCDCGNEHVARSSSLQYGSTSNCGCVRIRKVKETHTTHGKYKTTEYCVWENMKARCLNPNNPGYLNYGGRGIKICDQWINSFETFILDVGPRPSMQHTLDRFPNNDGNYEPGNVRWATRSQQQRNNRRNHWITYGGRKMILIDWAKELGINYQNLIYKLKRKSFEDILIELKWVDKH